MGGMFMGLSCRQALRQHRSVILWVKRDQIAQMGSHRFGLRVNPPPHSPFIADPSNPFSTPLTQGEVSLPSRSSPESKIGASWAQSLELLCVCARCYRDPPTNPDYFPRWRDGVSIKQLGSGLPQYIHTGIIGILMVSCLPSAAANKLISTWTAHLLD